MNNDSCTVRSYRVNYNYFILSSLQTWQLEQSFSRPNLEGGGGGLLGMALVVTENSNSHNILNFSKV